MANDQKENFDQDSEAENWSQYLTDELKRHFERTGRYLVEQQVLHVRYRAVEKRKAAMFWLGQQRKKDFCRQLGMAFGASLLAGVIGVAGALGGQWYAADRAEELQSSLEAKRLAEDRGSLIRVLSSAIQAFRMEEQRRRDVLSPLLTLLVEKDQTQEGGRPWIMAPVPSYLVAFETNAARFGLLAAPLPERLTRFYGLAQMLRSQVNTVTGPAIVAAGHEHKVFAVQQYENALKECLNEADSLLIALEAAGQEHGSS